MLKIGYFSKLSRISIRMLRHYDEMGLLHPAAVDDATGYRYYSEAQLPVAGRIQALKELGFSLSAISEILEEYDDTPKMEQFLLEKRRELEIRLHDTRQNIQLLDSTLKWLRKDGNLMGYDVTLKTIPERYVASVRQVIPAYDKEGELWKIMQEETAAQNIQPSSPSYSLAVFHDGEHKDIGPDVEVQIAVSGKYQDTEHVKFKTVAPIQIASATYKGSYSLLPQVNGAVANWIQENGYDFDGMSFCIYHVSPGETSNPEELVTEVCYPVRKK